MSQDVEKAKTYGRKASKSMQVVQPHFIKFNKQLNMNEVAKIKSLTSNIAMFENLI